MSPSTLVPVPAGSVALATDPGPSGPPLQPDREVHLLDRLLVIYKYRYPAIALFLAVLGWNMVDSYSQVPQYRATARIQIDDESAGIATSTDLAQSILPTDPEVYLNTQYEIIRGRELARRVVRKLDMRNVPEFNGQGPKPTAVAETIARIKGIALWPVRAVMGWAPPAPAPPPAPTSDVKFDADAYADQLAGRIGISPIRGTRHVDITFTGADPDFAVRAVNVLVEEYVAQNLETKKGVLDGQLEWLTAEVGLAKQRATDKQMELARYRADNDAGSLADNTVGLRVRELQSQASAARQTRQQKEAIWQEVSKAAPNYEGLSVIRQNPGVAAARAELTRLQNDRAQLLEKYGPNMPAVKTNGLQITNVEAQLKLAVEKAAQLIESEYRTAAADEIRLNQDLATAQATSQRLDLKKGDHTVLQQQAETETAIYNTLMQKEKELRIAANSRANNARIIDLSRGAGQISPDHRQDWITALFFATLLALGLAFGLDYLDDTIKTPEDIARRLKLRFLGLVPIVRGDRHPLLSGPVPHDFSEAFRSLRTSLVAQQQGDSTNIIAVTSAQPLEGKTTTAVNIAMALAVGGSRVLLIDADMRRPNVHKALRMQNDYGLSQLLAGQARMREVVQRTHDPNLMVISAGRTPSNPSELLASDRMRALVSGLETGPFDWVIIDTPPVLAVTDAVIVAPLVAGITFVVGSEMTRWRLAERAVQTLQSGNPRAIWALLNKVDFHRNKYYYSRYYGHQYKSYYQEAPAA